MTSDKNTAKTGGVDKAELISQIRERHLTIMVIDDDELFGRSLGFMLRRKYLAEVEIMNSGEEAMDAVLRNKSYDIVFTDLMMPGMTGTETLQGLKRINPALIVVIMSAFFGSAEWEEAKALGATVIHKPIDDDSLIQILSGLQHT